MKPIKVNVDAVPENKRTHPDFVGLLNDMTLGMADPSKVFSVCIHESGHLFFGLELKMQILDMDGPRIIYVEPDEFQGHGARVNVKVVANTIEEVAIMLSAGGVCSRELDNQLGSGDSEDFEIFKVNCRNVGVTDPAVMDSLWRNAQDIVTARLQDPAFREIMKGVAQHLMADLEAGEDAK
jgi:hypothetical protein